jgi:hypothetical protein
MATQIPALQWQTQDRLLMQRDLAEVKRTWDLPEWPNAWARFRARVLQHMNTEEAYIFPSLPGPARDQLLSDHERIRRALAYKGTESWLMKLFKPTYGSVFGQQDNSLEKVMVAHELGEEQILRMMTPVTVGAPRGGGHGGGGRGGGGRGFGRGGGFHPGRRRGGGGGFFGPWWGWGQDYAYEVPVPVATSPEALAESQYAAGDTQGAWTTLAQGLSPEAASAAWRRLTSRPG